jgi:ribonuclease-3
VNRSLSHWVPDTALLEEALTHSSYAHESGRSGRYNERLEFLGDAVVGLVVAEALFARHPDWDEGRLTRARAAVVSQPTLAEAGRRLGLGELLRLGRGEEQTGGRDKPSLLADALEAVVGAAFLARGWDNARGLALEALGFALDSPDVAEAPRDYKTRLAERLRQDGLQPVYVVVGESGPDHNKQFTVALTVAGHEWARGTGHSKKEAEQQAARSAWEHQLGARGEPGY